MTGPRRSRHRARRHRLPRAGRRAALRRRQRRRNLRVRRRARRGHARLAAHRGARGHVVRRRLQPGRRPPAHRERHRAEPAPQPERRHDDDGPAAEERRRRGARRRRAPPTPTTTSTRPRRRRSSTSIRRSTRSRSSRRRTTATSSATGKLGVDAGAIAGFDIYSRIEKDVAVANWGFAVLDAAGARGFYRDRPADRPGDPARDARRSAHRTSRCRSTSSLACRQGEGSRAAGRQPATREPSRSASRAARMRSNARLRDGITESRGWRTSASSAKRAVGLDLLQRHGARRAPSPARGRPRATRRPPGRGTPPARRARCPPPPCRRRCGRRARRRRASSRRDSGAPSGSARRPSASRPPREALPSVRVDGSVFTSQWPLAIVRSDPSAIAAPG